MEISKPNPPPLLSFPFFYPRIPSPAHQTPYLLPLFYPPPKSINNKRPAPQPHHMLPNHHFCPDQISPSLRPLSLAHPQPYLKTPLTLLPPNNSLHNRGANIKSREGCDLDALGFDGGGGVAAQEAGVGVVERGGGGVGEGNFCESGKRGEGLAIELT